MLDREQFQRLLDERLGLAECDSQPVVLLVLDLEPGRLTAQAAEAKLLACLRTGDMLGQLEKDRFVLVPADAVVASDAEKIAQKITDWLSVDTGLSEQPAGTGCHAGLAWYPQDAGTGTDLAEKAILAARQARETGQPWCFFAS